MLGLNFVSVLIKRRRERVDGWWYGFLWDYLVSAYKNQATNSAYLVNWISFPFTLLIESTECIYPACDPSRATPALFIVSHSLPKPKVLLGVRIIESKALTNLETTGTRR